MVAVCLCPWLKFKLDIEPKNIPLNNEWKATALASVQIALYSLWTTHSISTIILPIVDKRCAAVFMIIINLHCFGFLFLPCRNTTWKNFLLSWPVALLIYPLDMIMWPFSCAEIQKSLFKSNQPVHLLSWSLHKISETSWGGYFAEEKYNLLAGYFSPSK